MKYAVEMDSGVIIYILGFRKISSVIQKLMDGERGAHRKTESLVNV
jgi:hypothetical protein